VLDTKQCEWGYRLTLNRADNGSVSQEKWGGEAEDWFNDG